MTKMSMLGKPLNRTIGNKELSLWVDALETDPIIFNYLVFNGDDKVFESTDYNEAKEFYYNFVKESD